MQGAWAGKGAKKQKNARKYVTKVAGVEASKRKDAQLNHVIISEKKDKKAAKYMLKDLPFPYTSAAQHEHKLATPLGPSGRPRRCVIASSLAPSVLWWRPSRAQRDHLDLRPRVGSARLESGAAQPLACPLWRPASR